MSGAGTGTGADERTAGPQAPQDIARELAARAPRTDDVHESFAAVEERAHALLPALATARPAIGATPTVVVPSRRGRGRVRLKLESANTTGTVKARTAYALVCAAVAEAGSTDVRLVEYSGGSLALALADLCAAVGIDLHMVVPHGAPERLRQTLLRYGLTVSSGRRGTGFLGAMDQAVRVARQEKRKLLLQHCAPEAAAMHREHTGAELVSQLRAEDVEPVAFTAAVGSGSSLLGTSAALRELWPSCACVGVFPAEAPYGDERPPDGAPRMNGTGGLGHALRQPLLAPFESWFSFRTVPYPEALDAMRRLRSQHHLAVSSSGAGAWLAASAQVDDVSVPPGQEAVALVAGRGTVEEWAHAQEERIRRERARTDAGGPDAD
ncbi:MAG TPA: PLP-dependent lyase/thiolase [Streptomyces sp.]|nr:PLP-dependent lyase/thiolase [Streptomyces sp.]